jgi:hypothetical protein
MASIFLREIRPVKRIRQRVTITGAARRFTALSRLCSSGWAKRCTKAARLLE